MFRRANVAVDSRSIRKVTAIELLQLRINLAREDTVVSKTLKGNPKTTKASKKVNEPQRDRHLRKTKGSLRWARVIRERQTTPWE